MLINVAPAGFSDWPALLRLIHDAFADMEGRIDPPSSLTGMDIEAFMAKAVEETLIVAYDGRTLVGCAFAALRPDCIYVGKIAVAESARGMGVARAMLTTVDTLARQHGRACLELQTRVQLVENQRAFGALGFQKVAETAHPGYHRPTSVTMRRRVPQTPEPRCCAAIPDLPRAASVTCGIIAQHSDQLTRQDSPMLRRAQATQ